MKSHPYEYKILVEYLNPEKVGLVPHFTHPEDQEGLTMALVDVFRHLPASMEEGWEVVSHDIAESRNTLIVTILLKRLKKA